MLQGMSLARDIKKADPALSARFLPYQYKVSSSDIAGLKTVLKAQSDSLNTFSFKRNVLTISSGLIRKLTGNKDLEPQEYRGHIKDLLNRNYGAGAVEIKPVLLRAQEMSRYVEDGTLDCGITGADWIVENGSKVEAITELQYSKATGNKVRWVLAVPEDGKIRSVKDLQGKKIATEVVGITKKYLAKHKVKAHVEFSWGATEAKVTSGLVDAIVELTETGSSLRANKLRIVETLCESFTQFIANKASFKDAWKRNKIEQIVMLLKGALAANNMVGLKLNIQEKDLKSALAKLPALKNPTIAPLAQEGWVAVETIIEENVVRTIIPVLKESGAEGIIEYSINKLIY